MIWIVDTETGVAKIDGGHTIADEMAEVNVQGVHCIPVGADDIAELELKYRCIQVLPPIGKKKRYLARLGTSQRHRPWINTYIGYLWVIERITGRVPLRPLAKASTLARWANLQSMKASWIESWKKRWNY